ncbi:MAG: DUF4256 domain-containing protein [Chitinophagaceae bacterium]|nr:DUF4256 domain-containing protein [Chitinophagaceae bacterium]
MGKKLLSAKQQKDLLVLLENRYEKNMNRHKGLSWKEIQSRLTANPDILWTLNEMEKTEGEPDVVLLDSKSDDIFFVDCSAESPKGRRSLCYDREGLDSRKEFKPENNVIDLAAAMGVDLLTEAQYRALQKFGPFDTKTSSWILTPAPMRKLGGALFADYRYGQVFVYHNGAQSYYAGRAFRGAVKI